MSRASPATPVLVGIGEASDRAAPPETARGPLALMADAARAALADCGGRDIALDTVAVVRLFADSSPAFASPFGTPPDMPRALAAALGQTPATALSGPVGGNTPQMLVNHFAEQIRRGAARAVLIAGGEAQRTQARAVKAGLRLDWAQGPGSTPETLGPETPLVSAHEIRHGIALPVHVYPLFENALGHHYGRTPRAHRAAIGRLMAPFTRAAADNPHAAVPVARTPEALITPTDENRMIAYPYTKYLVANLLVDQAAAVLMMSTAAADAAGVPEHRRVYLHGAADTHEPILVSHRIDYHGAPAIRIGAAQALAQAGVSAAALDHIELYSCFPSAVAIAADAIGIAHDDPRGLTLTGGLPYFGGPGNNYSLHGIAAMVARCRAQPGSTGLVFANGGYLTKHSFGVYSTRPAPGWALPDAGPAQAELDALPAPRFTERPAGAGHIETFTVAFDRGAPAFGIIVARLPDGTRALAQLHAGLHALIDAPVIGRSVELTAGDRVNVAVLA